MAIYSLDHFFPNLEPVFCSMSGSNCYFLTCKQISQEADKQKNKCKKSKWLSEEALQIAEKRREAKCKGEKERYTHQCKTSANLSTIGEGKSAWKKN